VTDLVHVALRGGVCGDHCEYGGEGAVMAVMFVIMYMELESG
jgi:hypothetical protein